jgi:hypothetical protein
MTYSAFLRLSSIIVINPEMPEILQRYHMAFKMACAPLLKVFPGHP